MTIQIPHLQQLGKGCYFAKTDREWVRIIPVHTADHDLLGFIFKGQYYVICLPVGISSACAIFEHFSTALHWVAVHILNIFHMVHILDDFLILNVDFLQCQSQLNSFLSVCHSTGVPMKLEKTESARQVITFMGLELDCVSMEARLPNDKLCKLRSKLLTAAKFG